MKKEYKRPFYGSTYDQDKFYLRETIGTYKPEIKKYDETDTGTYDKNSANYKFLRHTINHQSNLNYTEPKSRNQYETRFDKSYKERKYGEISKNQQFQYTKKNQREPVGGFNDYKYKSIVNKEAYYEEISSPLRKIKSPERERIYTEDNLNSINHSEVYTPTREQKNQSKPFYKKESPYEKNYLETKSPQKVSTSTYNNFKNSRIQDKITSNYSIKEKNHSDTLTASTSNRYQTIKRPKLSLNNFNVGKCLGQGKFGNVYMVVEKDTGALFALKKVKKSNLKEQKLENQFMMEIKMQMIFKNKHILSLYGFFDDEQYIYLILEFMEEGSLYSYFKKRNILNEPDTSCKIQEILKALDYLHSLPKPIAHRDIKPENIVLSNGVCKLCDFGSSAVCVDRRTTIIGTVDYISPNILKGEEYGVQVDLWGIGVLCFQLLVGKSPFYHSKIKQTMTDIMQCDLSKVKFPATLSSEAEDFIRKLLVEDPEQRMKANQAIQHPFIVNYMEEQDKERLKNRPRRTF